MWWNLHGKNLGLEDISKLVVRKKEERRRTTLIAGDKYRKGSRATIGARTRRVGKKESDQREWAKKMEKDNERNKEIGSSEERRKKES